MNAFLSRFFPAPNGGGLDARLAFDGWPPSWTLLLAAAITLLVWIGYRWGAPALTPKKRLLLTALRTGFFLLLLLLLLRPVILLTLNEPVRGRLLVLLDSSASMEQKDRRTDEADRRRASIAAGLVGPKDSGPVAEKPGVNESISRADLLRKLAANDKLRLWERLHDNADLTFYSFGSEVGPASTLSKSPGIAGGAQEFFKGWHTGSPSTAIGDSLRQVLDESRGQSLAGILLISDGGNNSGAQPEEIAALAKQDGVPIYVYGTGITKPKDIMVSKITGPRGGFVKEYAEFSVKVRAPGYSGRTFKLVLKEDDKVVKEKEITIPDDTDHIYTIGYEPTKTKSVRIGASIAPEPDEAESVNNAVTTRFRVLDSKLKVLYIEQEPRWDFRYLLATLDRDPRLLVQCLLYDGDPVKPEELGKPLLKTFPESRAALVDNAVVILGDVNPAELGETRMKALREWVGDMGGALIFLAGAKNDPFRYGGTPLEPLLPVELKSGLAEKDWKVRSRDPVPLRLTPAGELSPLLRLAEDPTENRKLWAGFPGVRWTARVARPRPGAQVLLEDSTPANASTDGLMPVMATMAYGQGAVLYLGFDETYRWRSKTGETYYSKIWNQIIQAFAIDRQLASSPQIQLQPDRAEYQVGERARISGRLFDREYRPLTEDSVPATWKIRRPDGTTGPPVNALLLSLPGRPGEYELEIDATIEGTYTLTTALDPAAEISFEASKPSLEMSQTAMNEPLLRAVAGISGGEFLREEDLDGLPEKIKSRSATLPVIKKVEPAYSPWWLLILLLLLCTEWLLRRLWNLK